MCLRLLVALLAISLVRGTPTAPSANGVEVSLLNRRSARIRNADGTVHMPNFLAELNHVLVKYSFGSLSEKHHTVISKRQANEPLTAQTSDSDEDLLYYGSGTVGTDVPQTFAFNFDTGSADLFVPGPACDTSQGCPGDTKYSQTGMDLGTTTNITYGSGAVVGNNYLDSVTVAGLTAVNQNVVSLTQAQGFNTSAADSLLGMAFQSIARSNAPPFFQTLIAQGTVTTQEFAFYLGRAQSGTQNLSTLTLGGRDTSKYTEPITQVPVTSQTYWQVALDNIALDGQSLGERTVGQAAIDTGTTVILVPGRAAIALFSQIPDSSAVLIDVVNGNALVGFFYPCSFAGTVSLTFAGQQFAINPLDFSLGEFSSTAAMAVLDLLDDDANIDLGVGIGLPVLSRRDLENLRSRQEEEEPICLGSVVATDIAPDASFYVVGDSFLKNWYSVYSFDGYYGLPSVSFAAAVGNH